MTQVLLDSSLETPLSGPPTYGIAGDALRESSQRWRHLLGLAADLAFETDSKGRFVFVMPDTVLGWPAGALIGQPSETLVGDEDTGAVFNPFLPTAEIVRHRTWVRCCDGGLAMMTISAAPLHDKAGQLCGARGVAIDVTESGAQASQIAGRLRQGDTLDRMLVRVGQETNADGMMDAALWALIHAFGAEGAAVIGAATEAAPAEMLHECGPGGAAVVATAGALLAMRPREPRHADNPDGRHVLAVGCETRFGANVGVAVWRNVGTRQWDKEDMSLAASAVSVVRMILEYEAVQQELAHQACTDSLTGLLNRRAFQDEMRRQIARSDRESEAGTLLFADLDGFKAVNDQFGHAAGDRILVHLAELLRKLVRPSDLVARLGGDEFAIWLGGADHMTAAERADHLCKTAPVELQALLEQPFPSLGVSVGIATRRAGSQESIEALSKRADIAMYEVKRNGRRHWRVALQDSAA